MTRSFLRLEWTVRDHVMSHYDASSWTDEVNCVKTTPSWTRPLRFDASLLALLLNINFVEHLQFCNITGIQNSGVHWYLSAIRSPSHQVHRIATMQSHTSSTTTICATLGVSSIGNLRFWFIEKHLWDSFRYTSSYRYFLTSRTFWDCTEDVGDDCLLHFQSSHVQNVDSPCPISSAVLLQYCWAEDSNNSRTKIGRIAVWSEDSISPWRVEQVIPFFIFVRVGSECVPWNVTYTARIQFDIFKSCLDYFLDPSECKRYSGEHPCLTAPADVAAFSTSLATIAQHVRRQGC